MSKPIHCQCQILEGPEDIQHIKCALCASAPALLEACKLALKDLEAEMVWGSVRDALTAAIAAAEAKP